MVDFLNLWKQIRREVTDISMSDVHRGAWLDKIRQILAQADAPMRAERKSSDRMERSRFDRSGGDAA